MTAITDQIDNTTEATKGRLSQAHGIAREQVGNLTNDQRMRLGGKKDQLKGKLRARFGNSWLFQHWAWVVAGMLAAAASGLLGYFLTREESLELPATSH